MCVVSDKRTRNVTRRREAGAASRAQTRRLLVVAAGEEFARVGYVAATVSRIAENAGVTVQTLYLAWGSKHALLRAYLESTLAPDASPSGEHFAAQLHPDTPAGVVTQIAALFCGVAQRCAVAWQAYRDGAAVDAAIAEDWRQIQALRRNTLSTLLAAIPDEALRVSREDAIDTVWAVASPAMYAVLISDAGYTIERFQTWIATTLQAAILHP